MGNPTANVLIKGLSADLWHRVKVEAAKRKLTARRIVELALEDWLHLNESKEGVN